mmetsp:Transcript_19902/g.61398  ORF Transcript_19902/g.61398 Transcript_19902/m.61398 type:complete len:203 (-) Transcript_19902:393-1001(-)
MIRSKPAAICEHVSSKPARGGSTNNEPRPIWERSTSRFCSRRGVVPVLSAPATSSAGTLATRTLFMEFVARLRSASATDALDSSVATTRSKFGAKATVKVPPPQYSSQRSPSLPSVASWAQASIFSQTPAFGCVKAPSCCAYVNARPFTSSFSVTVSSLLPTTTLNLRDRPTIVAPVFWCRSWAACSHSSVVNSLQPLRSLL